MANKTPTQRFAVRQEWVDRSDDAAMVPACSLLAPGFADHVRETFPILATEAGRVAQFVVVTELMQSASRGDHPDLVVPLRTLAAELA
ncbi:hypothetical protein [Streptomyces sp. NPDC055299]